MLFLFIVFVTELRNQTFRIQITHRLWMFRFRLA